MFTHTQQPLHKALFKGQKSDPDPATFIPPACPLHSCLTIFNFHQLFTIPERLIEKSHWNWLSNFLAFQDTMQAAGRRMVMSRLSQQQTMHTTMLAWQVVAKTLTEVTCFLIGPKACSTGRNSHLLLESRSSSTTRGTSLPWWEPATVALLNGHVAQLPSK